ncbi:MAG: DUF2750 domain-containing protein [Alphaproteobacteria bacterium]|nr:DUF2750 domain-containing protein [Alphaproteobacteria bacterium]
MPLKASPLSSSKPCDQFVSRASKSMMVYAVAGEGGLARAKSRDGDGREVTFLWSDRAEAEKWAACIADNPRIKELPMGEVLKTLLPALGEHNRKIATDWSDAPDEPELEPGDVADLLRAGLIEAFVERAARSGSVWVVGGMYGPAMMVTRSRPEGQMLPCWSVRERAEMRLEGPWAEMALNEIPVGRFLEATLPGLKETGALLCPDNILGVETPEIAPDEMAKKLKAALVPA